jgi:predicted SAM-dependent methyltransferase
LRQTTINRIGGVARRVPGVAQILDRRVRRRLTRAPGPRRQPQIDPSQTRAWMTRLEGRTDLKLNIGAGPGVVEGWINADLQPEADADVMPMDATAPWPFADGSAEAINSEHFLEHIDPSLAGFYFQEAFRVLRPGGVIRTSTPDLRGLAMALLDEDPALLETHRAHGYEARNHADMVNNYIYSWGHAHIYDFESISALLAEAGFERIERVEFGESHHEALRGIDTHPVDDLHSTVVGVDAVKP